MKWLAIILTAMFTGAKIAGAITWSWWLVMLPAIIVFGIPIVFGLVVILMWLLGLCAIGIKLVWITAKDSFMIGFRDSEGINNESSKHGDQ